MPEHGESAVLWVARVHVCGIHPKQAREFLHHHLEHQFAQILLAVGACHQRAPVDTHPGWAWPGAAPGPAAGAARPWMSRLPRPARTRPALTGYALTGYALTGYALTGYALTGYALTGYARAARRFSVIGRPGRLFRDCSARPRLKPGQWHLAGCCRTG